MRGLREWAERCCKRGIEVWCMEKDSDTTGVYMTKQKIGEGKPCYSWTTPVYHAWVNDKCVLSCTNYKEAYGRYQVEVQNDALS